MTPEDIIKQTNDYRKSKGLPLLKVSPALMKAAQERAKDMASTSVFAHKDANGNRLWPKFIDKSGYTYTDAGENLAVRFDNATDTMKAWQKSSTHNQNLINPKYSDVGVAIVPGMYKGSKTNYIIQFFGTPKAAPNKPKTSTSTPSTPQIAASKTLKPFPISIRNANSTIPMVQGGMKLKLN